MLERGRVDVNDPPNENRCGRCPFIIYAARYSNVEIVHLLFKAGCSITETGLIKHDSDRRCLRVNAFSAAGLNDEDEE